MTTDWLEPVVLEGPTLRLVPLSVSDAADYRRALGPPEVAAEVMAHLSIDPPATDDEAATVIAAAIADPRRVAYAQRLRSTGELVGTTSFYNIDPGLRALGIGHTWLSRSTWRTHVNTESKLILLTRAFEGLGAERVILHTDIRNLRSQAAIERLGAQREGILRHHRIRRDGSWRDIVQYSMLAAEWPPVRDRLTARSLPRTPGSGDTVGTAPTDSTASTDGAATVAAPPPLTAPPPETAPGQRSGRAGCDLTVEDDDDRSDS